MVSGSSGPIDPNKHPHPLGPGGEEHIAPLGPGGLAPSNHEKAYGMWAKMFPSATEDQLKKIIGTFVNQIISQVKQDSQNMIEALKKLKDDQDGDN